MAGLGADDQGGAVAARPGAVTRVSPGEKVSPVESLGCARCGSCCEHAYLNVQPMELHMMAREGIESAAFILKHWNLNDDGESYRCDMLDRETGLCTAYDERPPVCEGYPWYGEDPLLRAKEIGPQCSYLLDVKPADRPEGARPLIPLTVLTRRS